MSQQKIGYKAQVGVGVFDRHSDVEFIVVTLVDPVPVKRLRAEMKGVIHGWGSIVKLGAVKEG